MFELLEQEQGIPAAKFDRVHAPIGIDIGARTPAEIAVCIMAEIINKLRDGPAVGLSEQIRRDRQARRARAGRWRATSRSRRWAGPEHRPPWTPHEPAPLMREPARSTMQRVRFDPRIG